MICGSRHDSFARHTLNIVCMCELSHLNTNVSLQAWSGHPSHFAVWLHAKMHLLIFQCGQWIVIFIHWTCLLWNEKHANQLRDNNGTPWHLDESSKNLWHLTVCCLLCFSIEPKHNKGMITKLLKNFFSLVSSFWQSLSNAKNNNKFFWFDSFGNCHKSSIFLFVKPCCWSWWLQGSYQQKCSQKSATINAKNQWMSVWAIKSKSEDSASWSRREDCMVPHLFARTTSWVDVETLVQWEPSAELGVVWNSPVNDGNVLRSINFESLSQVSVPIMNKETMRIKVLMVTQDAKLPDPSHTLAVTNLAIFFSNRWIDRMVMATAI